MKIIFHNFEIIKKYAKKKNVTNICFTDNNSLDDLTGNFPWPRASHTWISATPRAVASTVVAASQ